MISEDRLSHLASVIIDGVWKDDIVEYSDEDMAMRIAKKAASKFGQDLRDLDDFARKKVSSLKRNVVEGSPEWDVLYSKYYEEELAKRGN